MSITPNPLAGIRSRVETLESYSELWQAVAHVLVPENLDQLQRIFLYANDTGHRVTIRGGGHAFDAQSLGNDLVVSMERFNEITIVEDPNSVVVRAGAGATWGAIVERLAEDGLVAAGTVTTSHATVGGTLAADCLSRFSAAYGKEGARVVRFSLLTPDGNVLDCAPPSDGGGPAAVEQRTFLGAIGGLGYLGVFLEITFRVYRVEPPIRVWTKVQASGSFANLANALVPKATAMARADGEPGDANEDAISAGLYPLGAGRQSAVLFTSRFVTSHQHRPLLLYQPANPLVVGTEWLMRVPLLCQAISCGYWCYYRFLADGHEYIDDLEGFMFFMDANVRSKEIAGRLGFKQRTVQQTFFVPAQSSEDDRSAQDRLVQWLDSANDVLRFHGLKPTMQDVLFLQEDLGFYLSPNPGTEGFAVSYAFETSNAGTIEQVDTAFRLLSTVLLDQFQGRVSLVKNVCVDSDVLERMFGDGAREFFKLKAQLDPNCILRNDFLERTFPTLMQTAGCNPGTHP